MGRSLIKVVPGDSPKSPLTSGKAMFTSWSMWNFLKKCVFPRYVFRCFAKSPFSAACVAVYGGRRTLWVVSKDSSELPLGADRDKFFSLSMSKFLRKWRRRGVVYGKSHFFGFVYIVKWNVWTLLWDVERCELYRWIAQGVGNTGRLRRFFRFLWESFLGNACLRGLVSTILKNSLGGPSRARCSGSLHFFPA